MVAWRTNKSWYSDMGSQWFACTSKDMELLPLTLVTSLNQTIENHKKPQKHIYILIAPFVSYHTFPKAVGILELGFDTSAHFAYRINLWSIKLGPLAFKVQASQT